MELSIVQKIAVWALPLIFAITLHEVAHGFVAMLCGDYTAKLSGRLSLNPLRHIDPFGTVVLPLLMLVFTNFIFGWAKPVPVDPRNFQRPRRDTALVALAGPASNIVMALFWAAVAKLGLLLAAHDYQWVGVPFAYMGEAGIMINIVLGVLNLLPLPPLDGGNILKSLLSPRLAYKFSFIEPYSFFILILLLVSGVLVIIIGPPILFLQSLIEQLFGL